MHEDAITTTTASKFSNSTIVNSASLHQSNHHDDGTITVSILHPHHVEMEDFIASTTNLTNAPCSTVANQIVSSQTKIIVSSNEFQALKGDVSSLLINGTISNTNDPNVLILPATETCDKDTLSLSQMTSSQVDQVEIDLQDINSANDETSSGEGELSTVLFFFPRRIRPLKLLKLIWDFDNSKKGGIKEIIIARSEQMKAKGIKQDSPKMQCEKPARKNAKTRTTIKSTFYILLSHKSPVTHEISPK